MTDFSEKNQWALIDKYFAAGENGKISQFLRDNNYNFGDEIKHYSAVLEKYNKVKKFSQEDQKFIIEEGKRSGKNLLQKKFSHLIPSNIMLPPVEKQTELRELINELRPAPEKKVVPKTRSFLEILATMTKEEKNSFFQIMEDVSESNLPKLLRLVEYSDKTRQ
jgi:ribosome-binding ATPase YchF (GTP1/OBG family)